MATEKNITMKQYNGTDYDMLYPKTTMNQIIGITDRLNQLEFIQKYITAGSYTWTCPEDGEYFVVIIGGGESGSTLAYKGYPQHREASGGASGYVTFFRGVISKGQTKSIVVGAGGAGKIQTDSIRQAQPGNPGGTSSFDGVTAFGGTDGKGGQNASRRGRSGFPPPCGGVPIIDPGSANTYEASLCSSFGASMLTSNFLDEKGLSITHLCAGGQDTEDVDLSLANGKTVSPGRKLSETTNPPIGVTVTPTDCGAGSGGISLYGDNIITTGLSISSANGADGGVFIYKVGGASA